MCTACPHRKAVQKEEGPLFKRVLLAAPSNAVCMCSCLWAGWNLHVGRSLSCGRGRLEAPTCVPAPLPHLKFAPSVSVLPQAAGGQCSPTAAKKMRHRIIKHPLFVWMISSLKWKESWCYQCSWTGTEPSTGAFSPARPRHNLLLHRLGPDAEHSSVPRSPPWWPRFRPLTRAASGAAEGVCFHCFPSS